ncbi:putative transposase [Escherichia coli 1-110-08_S3_C2]|nr:putative transposase [Escherichia coli 1-110-08_S3_C2]
MLPSETMIWQPEFTDKTLSRKPGAVQGYDPHTCQFTDFELTDSRDAERLDRFAQTADAIRIADRGFG